jgi:hypothetical protein
LVTTDPSGLNTGIEVTPVNFGPDEVGSVRELVLYGVDGHLLDGELAVFVVADSYRLAAANVEPGEAGLVAGLVVDTGQRSQGELTGRPQGDVLDLDLRLLCLAENVLRALALGVHE